MSETCIVCLGDLGENANDQPPSLGRAAKSPGPEDGSTAPVPPTSTSPSRTDDSDNALIAHLLPCGHNLHNECLKPWVERANSCPICRQSFNQVELTATVGGEIVSSYTVSDRTQVAEVDPSMIVDEEYEEPEDRPCPVCRDDDHEEVLLACDGCDAYYHTYCVGLDEVPVGHWFCESCETQRAIESVCPTSGERPAPRSHNTADRRTRAQQRRQRNRVQASSSNWARVWQSVWDNLNLDLDFPFDEDADSVRLDRTQRAASQRREFRQWERRLQVAERQGGRNRFRETAPLLDIHAQRDQAQPPKEESNEEIRAWNAFEKAKEIDAHPSPKRKRKSATTSPSEAEPPARPERPLKRPRTRRAAENGAQSSNSASDSRRSSLTGPSSTRRGPADTANTAGTGPSFLQSMLREIETSTGSNDTKTPARMFIQPNHGSPQDSSPGASPTSSNYASPRARSITPPPSTSPRPGSPVGLTSRIEPVFPQPEYSPSSSPVDASLAHRSKAEQKRQTRSILQTSSPARAEDTSPTRNNMPFSTKADLQKMVSTALKPHYQSNVISKDQYTDINRNISRLLYDKVGGAGYVIGKEREEYEQLANDEVTKAVGELTTST